MHADRRGERLHMRPYKGELHGAPQGHLWRAAAAAVAVREILHPGARLGCNPEGLRERAPPPDGLWRGWILKPR